jgi:hypothetical protein
LSHVVVQALHVAVLIARAKAGDEMSHSLIGMARAMVRVADPSKQDPAWLILAAQLEALSTARSGAERAATLFSKVMNI